MWKNPGRDVYIRAFGHTDWDHHSEAQFVPIPGPPWPDAPAGS